MSVSQSFDGRDVRICGFFGHAKAGEARFSINQNCTTSAGPHIASTFDTECTRLVAEYVEKDGIALDQMFMCLTVDIRLPSLLSSTRQHGDSNMDGHGERVDPVTDDL